MTRMDGFDWTLLCSIPLLIDSSMVNHKYISCEDRPRFDKFVFSFIILWLISLHPGHFDLCRDRSDILVRATNQKRLALTRRHPFDGCCFRRGDRFQLQSKSRGIVVTFLAISFWGPSERSWSTESANQWHRLEVESTILEHIAPTDRKYKRPTNLDSHADSTGIVES